MSPEPDCTKCGTDHDGYEPGTYGAQLRCLRLQAEALGAGHLVDQLDTAERNRLGHIEAVLFDPPESLVCVDGPGCPCSRCARFYREPATTTYECGPCGASFNSLFSLNAHIFDYCGQPPADPNPMPRFTFRRHKETQ
jgi:hypothetical protein